MKKIKQTKLIGAIEIEKKSHTKGQTYKYRALISHTEISNKKDNKVVLYLKNYSVKSISNWYNITNYKKTITLNNLDLKNKILKFNGKLNTPFEVIEDLSENQSGSKYTLYQKDDPFIKEGFGS